MTVVENDVITELKTYLKKREEKTEHVAFQFKDASFSSADNSIVIDGKDIPVTSGAFRQLSEVLNIPVPYAQRIPDDLLDHTVNYFLSSREDNYYAALVEDDLVRSFMPTTNPYVSGLEFFGAIEEAFGGDYDLKYVKVNDVDMSFSILPHEYKNAIDGTDLFGGLRVKFSDSWNTFPSLDTYIWREICSNGMIDTLKSRKFRIKNSSSNEVISQVQEFARLSLDALPALFDQYQALLSEPVANYARMISRICSDYRLASKVKDRVLFWADQDAFLDTISDNQIKNMHDIVNLFTFVGSHDLDLTDDIREMLLSIGGNLTMSHADRCGSCGNNI